MLVKPAAGRTVRDPVSKQPIPDSGKDVPESTYWLRRLACGDVVVVQPSQIPDSKEEE